MAWRSKRQEWVSLDTADDDMTGGPPKRTGLLEPSETRLSPVQESSSYGNESRTNKVTDKTKSSFAWFLWFLLFLLLLGAIASIILSSVAVSNHGIDDFISGSTMINVTEKKLISSRRIVDIISLRNIYSEFGFENNSFCSPTGHTQYEYFPPVTFQNDTDTDFEVQENWYSVSLQNTIINTDPAYTWLDPQGDSVVINSTGSYIVTYTIGMVIADLNDTVYTFEKMGSVCAFIGAIDALYETDPYSSPRMYPKRLGMACHTAPPISIMNSTWTPFVPVTYISSSDIFYSTALPSRLYNYFTFLTNVDVGITIISSQFKVLKIN